jgi:hypothetical protein
MYSVKYSKYPVENIIDSNSNSSKEEITYNQIPFLEEISFNSDNTLVNIGKTIKHQSSNFFSN